MSGRWAATGPAIQWPAICLGSAVSREVIRPDGSGTIRQCQREGTNMQGSNDRCGATAAVWPVLHRRGRLVACWSTRALARRHAMLGMALLVALLSSPASAVDVITNGGFETGNFTGWN